MAVRPVEATAENETRQAGLAPEGAGNAFLGRPKNTTASL